MGLNSTDWTRVPLGNTRIDGASWSIVGLNRDGRAFAVEIVKLRQNGTVSNTRICMELPEDLSRDSVSWSIDEVRTALEALERTLVKRLKR